MTILPSPYQFGYLLFLFQLLWLGLKILSWIEEVRVGILVSDFSRKAFSFSLLLYWSWVCHSFYYVEVCSLYTHFHKSFYHKWMLLSFIKCPLYLLRWPCGFCLLLMCITLINLCMLNFPSDRPCSESNLVVVHELWNSNFFVGVGLLIMTVHPHLQLDPLFLPPQWGLAFLSIAWYSSYLLLFI